MEIEKELRGFVSALGPDGFLVVRTRQISALCDEVDRLKAIESAPRKPMTRDEMRKLLAEHFDNGDLTGADFSLIRAVERFHQIEEQP
jgi:hypothetical protein